VEGDSAAVQATDVEGSTPGAPEPAPIVALELPVPGQAATEAEAFGRVQRHLTDPGAFRHLGAEARADLEELARHLAEWRRHLLLR
jgi:hypothetical protein